MIFDIQPVGEEANKNIFEVVLTFMHGDADGYDHKSLWIHEDLLKDKDYMLWVNRLFECIEGGIKEDSKGRGGIDDIRELAGNYQYVPHLKAFAENFNQKSYYKVDNDEIDNDYEWQGSTMKCPHHGLTFHIPTEHMMGEYYASFDKIEVFYYDSIGTKHNVKYSFDEKHHMSSEG